MDLNKVLIKPVITEKSTSIRDKQNKYVFVVDKKADKITICRAIKNMFNVSPLKINVVNVNGKLKRVRYKYGFTSSFKKAVVTLKKGDKIAIFEGV
ncbi:MAG TPA: 50S ribosomal protein L23 [Spirochaetota bacterium]|nr:50S ribosomal protein L23 [Spirochaetota bacterium]HOF01626.1 50S ribosomal protein L23 [Spirochaetota bacterium]HOS33788.1 50S ribosomal protein L23 [Spirochaetota bacterium]HOS55066.1 50S ribosomal protein L23 [Spirochaetota bacterium]HQF77694.1 50S ribosomal protein L23 [Spirochaetota bacterium]